MSVAHGRSRVRIFFRGELFLSFLHARISWALDNSSKRG